MPSHSQDKNNESKSRAVANGMNKLQGNATGTFQLVNNSPVSVAQRKLKEIADKSQQVQQLSAYQEMANDNPRIRQFKTYQAVADQTAETPQSAIQPAEQVTTERSDPVRKKENLTGLPDRLKTGIENLSGLSMDDVKVHYNSGKPAQLKAHAYAQGADIHIAPGQEQHLPHEAWHVVQQKQGRVQPTVQMKGKMNVNDDTALEREADIMGDRAFRMNTHPSQNLSVSATVMGSVIQAKMKPVTEEQVKELEDKGEVDASYMDGLYTNEAQDAFFVYAKGVPETYVGRSNPERQVHFFVRVELMTEAGIASIFDNPSNMILISENEDLSCTAPQLAAEAERIIGNGAGEALLNSLMLGAMNGEPKGGAGGEYGSIEFRFKKPEGYILTTNAGFTIPEAYKDVRVDVVEPAKLEKYKRAHASANLPYTEERVGADYIFVDDQHWFLIRGHLIEVEDRVRGDAFRLNASDKAAPPVDAPADGTKRRDKRYVRTAMRGDRGTGQKAAMNNVSAQQYVEHFMGDKARNYKWEWLHLQGSRLGGPNDQGNLVAGTESANSHMIPWEREILKLSRDADEAHPVNVTWHSTLHKVGAQHTHVGNEITLVIDIPGGTKSNATARNIRKTFHATETGVFTKRDRDVAHQQARAGGGRHQDE